ncbi:MAG: hypothetical protein ACE5IP_10690 [Terriglobia bacterium]
MPRGRSRRLYLFAAGVFFCLLLPAPARTQQPAPPPLEENKPELQPLPEAVRRLPDPQSHRFWDKTNLALFAGVGTARAFDFTSTRNFRSRGRNEALLTNAIVDNKPLFAAIEVAGTAASIGLSYWLHKTGHHKLERWVSIFHFSVGTFGALRNYSLRSAPTVPGAP